MTLNKMLEWLRALFSNRSFQVLVLQVLGTIGLIYLTEIWMQNPDIQLIAELGIAAFGFFAVSQTYLLTTDFHRYITRELLTELASSQGRFIRRVVIDKDFKEIHPGDECTVQFLIEGKQLIQVPVPKMLTPVLRMEPPLFKGNVEDADEQFSIWHGQPLPCNLKEDGTWELRGQVKFDTHKISPTTEASSVVALNLGFRGENGLLFDLELGCIPVHLLTRHEVFRDLIRLGVLKKLPPGHHVLAVSPDSQFHTNLILLSKRLYELGSEEEYGDQVRGLEAAMARFINEAFTEIIVQHPRLELAKYESQPYESEVNFSALLDNVLTVITYPSTARPTGRILVAIYQTREFVMQLEREGGFGICLFGFGPIAPSNVQVVFDLCQLKLNHDEAGNPCQVDLSELKQLADSSREYFERYATRLIATLTKKQHSDRSQGGQSTGALSTPKTSERASRELEPVLSLIQPSANTSLRYGCFVSSEPITTSYWINLGIFEDALYKANVQNALREAIIFVVDRCTQTYEINTERLCIINLCSEHSGIANELPTLWQFKHPRFPTYAVGIDQETKSVKLPYEVTDINLPKEVILLVPFDSYVSTLGTVLQTLRDYKNSVICIVSLFSMAETWDY
ncbi:MAG: hypothetical protein ACFE7R_05410, partial [Candidatus Hodarchaeota archaeon]